jgi:Trypsin
MKIIVVSIFIVLAASAAAQDKWDIDWSKAVPVDNELVSLRSLDLHPEIRNGKEQRSRRVVGGQIVAPNSLPFQVSLRIINPSTGNMFCSGSIVAPRAVLTAAHWYSYE